MEIESNITKKVKIAETYFRIKVEYNDENINSVEKTLIQSAEDEIRLIRRFVRIRALNILLEDNPNQAEQESNYDKAKNTILTRYIEREITFIISIEEGSVKARISYYTNALVAIYLGVGTFGDFVSGVGSAKDVSTFLSERVINSARHSNSIIANNLERTERRTGLIGRLKRTLDGIEQLQNNLHGLSNDEIRDELARLHQDLANIIAILPTEDQESILNSLPVNTRQNLPQPIPYEIEHLSNLYALKPEDMDDKPSRTL